MILIIREVSRKFLQDSIEAGIQACPDMDDSQKTALRHVGATASSVVRGAFYNRDRSCGCPLWQAGLAWELDEEILIADRCTKFYTAFDSTTHSSGYRARLLRVVC